MYVFFPFNLLVFHEDFQSEAELFELLTFHLKSGHCSSSEKQEPIQKWIDSITAISLSNINMR